MTFEENFVNPLGKVGLGGAGCVGLFREVQVGQLGPYWAWSIFLWDLGIGLAAWGGRW